ncbi:phosphoribosylanthranilate isomerase [Humisphaera borealis]|uniref:N-(5'-phosphoribosyl)anthranilate isomerase n=1 Tax=Humisphaera borealis TaxID=2807512 RepID=A0A7M2WXW3_9BACT|nr:phosphoribosylanthranilate isomerase [Humisphaera borealis]QOV89641.1 phosphoribosylanthranilate isomerase [Humisphaera borealis]
MNSTPNHHTRVKICGVRHPEDAAYAARSGADAIGVICYPKASRYVAQEEARLIVQTAPPFVTPVALFVDSTPGEIAAVVSAIGATCVQLHGHESPDVVRKVNLPVLKAIRVDRTTFEAELGTWRKAIAEGGLEHLQGLVLETAAGTGEAGVGGTGLANDWTFVRQVAAKGEFAGLPPIIAAGGLTPETVGEVIQSVRPWAVDVSSGVEVVKARKSPKLIKAFIAAVRQADLSKAV